MKAVNKGFRRLVANAGKWGRETVCNSNTQRPIKVSQRQYLPHSRYPRSPSTYMNMAATP